MATLTVDLFTNLRPLSGGALLGLDLGKEVLYMACKTQTRRVRTSPKPGRKTVRVKTHKRTTPKPC